MLEETEKIILNPVTVDDQRLRRLIVNWNLSLENAKELKKAFEAYAQESSYTYEEVENSVISLVVTIRNGISIGNAMNQVVTAMHNLGQMQTSEYEKLAALELPEPINRKLRRQGLDKPIEAWRKDYKDVRKRGRKV